MGTPFPGSEFCNAAFPGLSESLFQCQAQDSLKAAIASQMHQHHVETSIDDHGFMLLFNGHKNDDDAF